MIRAAERVIHQPEAGPPPVSVRDWQDHQRRIDRRLIEIGRPSVEFGIGIGDLRSVYHQGEGLRPSREDF